MGLLSWANFFYLIYCFYVRKKMNKIKLSRRRLEILVIIQFMLLLSFLILFSFFHPLKYYESGTESFFNGRVEPSAVDFLISSGLMLIIPIINTINLLLLVVRQKKVAKIQTKIAD
jgi:hypothetical protein